MRWLMLLLSCAITAVTLGAQDAGQKAPVPNEAAQKKAWALVQDIFKEDMDKAKDPQAKVKLANDLLQQGRDSRDDLANRYVLFREARVLASKAGDANLTLRIIEEMGRNFEVNSHKLKAEALVEVAENVTSKESGQAVVDLVLPIIDDALDADNYEAAIALGKVAETAARKSKVVALVTAMQKRNEDIAAIQKNFSRLQGFIDRLAKDPKDAQANLEMGKYYALFKGRWEKALPHLALGSDEALKNLAGRDLAKPKEAKDRLALADGWWELAGVQQETAQLQMQRRAMFWYEQALANLAGLNRTKALKRIEVVSARLQGSSASEGPSGPVGELKKFVGHSDEVKCVALSSDGHYGLSGGGESDRTVRLWDLVSGKEEKAMVGHHKQIWGVGFLPSSRQALSVSWDATARLWDLRTGNELHRFAHRKDLNGLAISRDGNTFLTASDDFNVYLWNISGGEELKRFTGNTNFVYAVAFAPDGRHIASGGMDKSVRIFDFATGNQVKIMDGSQNAVTNVAYTPDGRFLLSSGDSTIHMWDVATGKEVRKFEGHSGLVPAMALSPDGRRLLTGGDDKTIRLWDVSTGKELHKFQGHTETVLCVAFSSDGRRALSGSLDRTVRLWGLPTR